MEFHGQWHTSAADDGRLRRFPDPPPPAHARDADALPRDEASLVRRRDELLWELHQEQVRLNMILRELVETEYAMAAHPAPASQTLTKGALGPAMANASVRPIRSPFVRQEVTTGNKYAVGGERKADLEEGHGVQPLFQGRNQSNGEGKAEATSMVDWPNEPGKLAGQDLPFTQQKRLESSEPWPGRYTEREQQQECRSSGEMEHHMSGYVELCPSPRKQIPIDYTLVPVIANAVNRSALPPSLGDEMALEHGRKIGGEPKVDDVEDDHGVRPLYKNRNQSNDQRKVMESHMAARIDEPLQSPSQSRPAGEDNAAHKEFSESTPVRISPVLKRRLSAATPLPKKKKPLEEPSSPVNHVDLTRQLHQSNVKVESLQARIKPTEPELNMKAMPGQGNSGRNWEPVRWDGEENVAEKKGSEDRLERWTCHICNAKCTSASNLKDHLGGRRHRERIEAILGEFRSSYRRMEAESGKDAYYCDVCKVHCADDTVMASHLTGRKHRETLQQL